MTKSELTDGEFRFVHQLIGEEPVWVKWVKKTNRKEVVQDRLLAVGMYRIFSIKRTPTGKKKMQRAGHIMGLKEIFSDDIDKIKLEFADFKIIMTGSNIGIELPRVLLNCFNKITFTFPASASPKLVLLPAERNAPVLDPIEMGIAGGLVETYFAQCDYLSIPPSSDVVTYLEDVWNANQQQLDLHLISGIQKASEFTFNLSPLMAALRHNTYFTSFSCHEKSRKEVVALVADVIAHNVTLTSVDLTGMEVDEGWLQLGEALRSNSSHKIMEIYLSDNHIGDKGAVALGAGLACAHVPGLRALRLANTRLTAAGAGAIIKGICANRQYGNFEEIDFSRNALKGAAMSFSELVASMPQAQACLRRICIAHTQLDLAPLVDGIRNTLYGVVEHLDFTGSKMDEHAAKLCVYFFEKATAIKEVLLVDCGLTGQPLANILHSISSNGHITNLSLDISNNNLESKTECEFFCRELAAVKQITSLAIREMEFGKADNSNSFLQIIKTLPLNSYIRELDLSGNFKIKPKDKDGGLGPLQALASVVESHPSIIGLSIEGIGQNTIGKNLSPLFHALGDASKIQKLSVRGQIFGDSGAKELFDILRWNKSLTTLSFDNNHITPVGWGFVVRCLNANRTLVEVEYPKNDIARILGKSNDNAGRFALHDSIFSIFSKIATYTQHNRAGECDERGAHPSKPQKEHAYILRKARLGTMVISKVSSSSILPVEEDWSDNDSSESDGSSSSSSISFRSPDLTPSRNATPQPPTTPLSPHKPFLPPRDTPPPSPVLPPAPPPSPQTLPPLDIPPPPSPLSPILPSPHLGSPPLPPPPLLTPNSFPPPNLPPSFPRLIPPSPPPRLVNP